MLKPRQVVNQCYILQERVGEDSFFELWSATAIYSATTFLLRFLKQSRGLEEAVEAFRELALRSYTVAAPSVLDLVEVERLEGRTFVSSEYGGHLSLLSFLATKPSFKLEHACRFAIELGQGLDAFHKQGISYGCLNAENVLVLRSGCRIEEIRVQKPGYLPFLALLPEEPAAVLENYGYMAPELKAGEEPSPRGDIYSVGVQLFRFIVGRLPYGPKRARLGAPSPAHVARSLARRGVPPELSLSIVRALRRKPASRQGDMIAFIAELRAFVDARRLELLRQGQVDPVAELERLNVGKQRVDATQAVRSLDTADYFRAISEAPSAAPAAETSMSFPVEDFADPAEVARLEEREAEEGEDDEATSSEAYVERAAAEVAREGASRRLGAHPDGGAAAGAGPRAPRAAAAAAPEEEPSVGELYSGGTARRRDPLVRELGALDAAGVAWRRDAAKAASIVEGIESAFARSRRGTGSFRFIQEPPPGPAAACFARAFAQLREEGLVLDLGAFAAGSDATDLLRALRASIAKALAADSPRSRAVLARRLLSLDAEGALLAGPLGSLLAGKDAEEPDPDYVESGEGARRAALALASLGRRRRPLVLTLRGGEGLGRSAHEILIELARLAPIASFCAFVFYRPAPVPPWHVLARLGPGEGGAPAAAG
ncbi:MAG TPA: protein kinase [Spirochaetia bacterium]|nr:protein kinase [Spirochaetia bacterium]HRZ65225.1 protein kinase [Spirochaetia bacterium]